VTLADSSWLAAPSYPPQYLSTANEYIPPQNNAPDELTAGIVDDDRATQEAHPWASEKYESSMHTDHLFDKFNERAAHEPQQCVRCAPCVCVLMDYLSDEVTCVDTTLAEFLCPLRLMTYTNGSSPCPKTLLRQPSQGPPSTLSTRGQGVGTAQRLYLHARIAALAACSNIKSCRI
jgi:hypothetical protein